MSVSLLSSLNHSPTAVAKTQIFALSLAAESAPASGMRASVDLQLQATRTNLHINVHVLVHVHVHVHVHARRT